MEQTTNLYKTTQEFFLKVITAVENGELPVKIQAKCICVDARLAKPHEIGTKFTVWSHGKIEKEIIVSEDTVFITTLDENGRPIIDKEGRLNIYDMPFGKFKKKYHPHKNGYFVQDPTPMATINASDIISTDSITLLPPCWNGYTGTLMKNGLIMLPLNPELSFSEQVEVWKSYLQGNLIDWYPNNEPDTYAPCDKYGKFKSKKLRKLFEQTPQKQLIP